MTNRNDLDAIRTLFEEEPPILVEVAFGFTSSDWYLLEDYKEFEGLLEKLSGEFPVYLTPVGSIKSQKKLTYYVATNG